MDGSNRTDGAWWSKPLSERMKGRAPPKVRVTYGYEDELSRKAHMYTSSITNLFYYHGGAALSLGPGLSTTPIVHTNVPTTS